MIYFNLIDFPQPENTLYYRGVPSITLTITRSYKKIRTNTVGLSYCFY